MPGADGIRVPFGDFRRQQTFKPAQANLYTAGLDRVGGAAKQTIHGLPAAQGGGGDDAVGLINRAWF